MIKKLAPHTLHALAWLLLCNNIWSAVFVKGQTGTTPTWCIARSDASNQALQAALNYACGAGADCAPIQPSGLCYLPNTMVAHASYAFNSYYQRGGQDPGSCNFSGAATTATIDPSSGSCVYPSSQSTAGGTLTPVVAPAGGTLTPGVAPAGGTTNSTTNPFLIAPPPPPFSGNGLGMGIPDTSDAPLQSPSSTTGLILLSILYSKFVALKE